MELKALPKYDRTEKRRMQMLLRKHQKLIGSYEDLVEFEEPVLFLIRADHSVEWHQGVKGGKYTFKIEGEDDEGEVWLNPASLLTFDYGKRKFKGYIAYEKEAFPYPVNPVLSAQLFHNAIVKTISDTKDWNVQQTKATTELIWKIIMGVAILGIVFILYKMVIVPSNAGQAIQSAVNETLNVTANATKIIINSTR